MAGHFVLRSITASDIQTAQASGCTWSGLAHGLGAPVGPGHPPHAGWTQTSRQFLTNALAGGAPNRNGLPPHRYLGFGPFGGHASPLRSYILGAGWAGTVIRPNNMGLVGLCAAAVLRWNANDKDGAVLAQADFGATSIEIYYISGYEMS